MPSQILTVVGARPQFIKAAAVSRAVREAGVSEAILHTGQHSDPNMSDVFFDEMGIPKPQFSLGISGLTHGAMTGEMLKQIEEICLREKPKAMLVYGDTNSTLAGALAASKLHIPLAHVEAGLRSFNMRMPEEINRVITDRISNWLFCPTETAVENLNREGIAAPAYHVENVGDVMLDATLHFKGKARWPAEVPVELRSKPFLLCTLHRQESIDDPNVLRELISALLKIAEKIPVVWPVHPRAKKALLQLELPVSNLKLISPVGYLEMLSLLETCEIVATDSGGLQKEAYFFGKPCLTLRTETEWVELVALGANTICGHDSEKILKAFHNRSSFSVKTELYGAGHAAKRIATKLRTLL